MTFGERLRELRQDNDETQEQIGRILNIGARMISHYERNEHFPRDAKSIILLAEHFNVTTDYLFGISNIKNYNRIKELFSDYSSLSEENRKEVHDFMKYLLTKEQKQK